MTLFHVQFPSPLGVIYFQIFKSIRKGKRNEISVSSRSYLFPNFSQISFDIAKKISVSSRSYLFPNETDMTVTERNIRFPSPLGVIYFQITSVENYTKTLVDFRLLSELSISKYAAIKGAKNRYGFPSPLGVIYFQILSFKLQSLCTLQLEFAC